MMTVERDRERERERERERQHLRKRVMDGWIAVRDESKVPLKDSDSAQVQ
jgi:hypothetical protein